MLRITPAGQVVLCGSGRAGGRAGAGEQAEITELSTSCDVHHIAAALLRHKVVNILYIDFAENDLLQLSSGTVITRSPPDMMVGMSFTRLVLHQNQIL